MLDDELKNNIKIEVLKGLYSEDEIVERLLEDDEEPVEGKENLIRKEIAKWYALMDTSNGIKNQDVIKLKKALKVLWHKHKIVCPDVIGFTQDDSVYEADLLVNEKQAKGFVYFTEQDIERVIEHGGVFNIGFNCFNRDSDTAEERGKYIGKLVIEELQNQGFNVGWNKSMENRIAILFFQWNCKNYFTLLDSISNQDYQLVSIKEVLHLLPENSIARGWENEEGAKVIYFPKDAFFENINTDTLDCFLDTKKEIRHIACILVQGNLYANNIFNKYTDGSMGLIVLGGIYANNIVIGGQEIIAQKLIVNDLFWGHYNHGYTQCGLFASARVIVLTDEYSLQMPGEPNCYHFLEEKEVPSVVDIMIMTNTAKQLFLDDCLSVALEELKDMKAEYLSWNEILNRNKVINRLDKNQEILKNRIESETVGIRNIWIKQFNALKALIPILFSVESQRQLAEKALFTYELPDSEMELEPFEKLEGILEVYEEFKCELVLGFDHKAGVRDMAFIIKKALKDNFNVEGIELPKEEDYKGINYLLADVFIDFEIALLEYGFKLTFLEIDVDTYFMVLHSANDAKEVSALLSQFGFSSHTTPVEVLEEYNFKKIPIIFENKKLYEIADLVIQHKNYNKIFEIFKKTSNEESRIFLSETKAQAFINKSHHRKSDNKKVGQSIYFLLDDGAEIIVWLEKKNIFAKLINSEAELRVYYKNLNQNIFQYRSIFDIPNVNISFANIWEELLTHIEKGVYFENKFSKIVKGKDLQDILSLPMVKEKYPNSWNDAEQMPWFDSECYIFRQATDELFAAINISKENPNYVEESTEEYNSGKFDVRSLYFFNNTNTEQIDLAFSSSYYPVSHPLYNQYYCFKYTYVPFYDYRLYVEAIKLWRKALQILPDENHKYLFWKKVEEEQSEIDQKNHQQRVVEYKVSKPFENVNLEGITFKLYDRREASDVLKECPEYDGRPIIDAFDFGVNSIEDDNNSFYLVCEDEVVLEKLYLDSLFPDNDSLFVLGYIFLKPIKVEKYVEAFDLDFSPPIVCMDSAEIGSLILSGTTHYFHRNLTCINIYGKYNHGTLVVQGNTIAKLIVAEDFEMKFNTLQMVASISSELRCICVVNDLEGLGLETSSELNYLPATHRYQDCILDKYLWDDGEYGYRFKNQEDFEKNITSEKNETFYEAFKDAKDIIDEDKINRNYQEFITNGFAIIQKLFQTNEVLKNLPTEESHLEYPNKNYPHEYYFFEKTDTTFIIGKWNSMYHLSILISIDISDSKEEHHINITYWDEKNKKDRYSYITKLDKHSYHRHIGQKVFFEIVEWMIQRKF